MKYLPLLLLALLAVPAAAQPLFYLQADLDQPSAVAVDGTGRAYVLDGVNGRVAVFRADGEYDFSFGPAAGLRLPMGLALAGDAVYIADSGNHRLAVFDRRGGFKHHLMLPVGEGGPAEPVALLAADDLLYWSDRRNHRICRLRLDGEPLGCWGRRGAQAGEFQFPFQLAADRDGYVHAVDVLGARVQVFHPGGRHVADRGRFGLGPGELYRPNGLAVDAEDRLFVSDAYLGTVSVFARGRFMDALRAADGVPRRFAAPVGLARWRDRLYVVESQANRVAVLRLGAIRAAANETPAQASRRDCVICHLAWDPRYAGGMEQDGVPPVASTRMCYSCHHGAVVDSRRQIGRAGQHPDVHHVRDEEPNKGERKDEIPKAFPLHGKRLTCGSCHTPHGTDPEAPTLYSTHRNPWLRVLNRDGDLCARCHASMLDDIAAAERPKRGVNHPVGIRLARPPHQGAEGYAKSEKLQQGLPTALRAAGGALGAEAQMTCQSCHQIHGGAGDELLLAGNKQGGLCASCHERQHVTSKEEARSKGVHPVNIKLDEPIEFGEEEIRELRCATCHSVHEGREKSALLTRKAEVEKLCSECHERHSAADEKDARKKGVHPVNVELEEPVKLAGKEVKKLGCLSCHSVHNGKPDTPALVEEHRDGTLCGHCHEAQKAVVGTDHDLRITAKDGKNRLEETPVKSGACGACHTLHRGKAKAPFLYAGAFDPWEGEEQITQRDRLCLDCHREEPEAENKAVKEFSHPYRDLVLRSDPKTLPLLGADEKPAEFGRIGCITCHDPHRWRPKEHGEPDATAPVAIARRKNIEGDALNSFLRRKGAGETFCVDCHGLESRIKWKYYHHERARGKGIDYIE